MSNTFQAENPILLLQTGPLKALSLPLKTKDHVDHAGLSVLLDLLKRLTLNPPENYYLSLNKNQSTVLDHSETKDVMEDLWTMLSNSLKKTESLLKTTILTLENKENVMLLKKDQVLSKSTDSLMFLKTLPLKWSML